MTKDVFFPEEYDLPKSSGGFMKLQKGDQVFRFLGKVETGYEVWTEDNKPVRSRTEFKELPENAKVDKDGSVIKPKHIWVAPVWNYNEEDIQLITIAQRTVQEAILSYSRDSDWGNPLEYDIKVTRTGDGFETKYTVTPKPKTPVKKEILDAYKENEASLAESIKAMFE
jgi:hypothetical protein